MKAYLRAEDPNAFEKVFDVSVMPGIGEVLALRSGNTVRRFKVQRIEFELDNDSGEQSANIHVEAAAEAAHPDVGRKIDYSNKGIV